MKTIIIGGTAAGMSAAVKIQKMAKDPLITVYEKGEVVSFGACGLPYYVGDYFHDSHQMIAREQAAFEKMGIAVKLFHEVVAVDTTTKTVTVRDNFHDETFVDSYDQLLVASGATPIMPPVTTQLDGAAFENLFTLKTLGDGRALKTYLRLEEVYQVTIIGGGFIGVECAEAFLHQGKKVRLIQLDDHLLQDSFDEEISEVIEAKLRQAGVSLHLAEGVQDLVGSLDAEGNCRVTQVVTDQGEYGTDLVVVAIGVKPATDFLGPAFAKLANGALIVDDQGRTNVPDVWAAGDCATVPHLVTGDDRFIPLATGANKLGRIAGEVMAGADSHYPGTLGTAGVKFMELEAARTGITVADADKLGYDYNTVVIDDKNQTDYYPGQKDIRVKLIYDNQTLCLLGAQIAGENGAALRIDTLAAAITMEMTTKQLGLLDLLYAPPFARTWDVLNVAGNVAKSKKNSRKRQAISGKS
ncbi:CoA-disulfide reductase [Enterococcus diestrammenae]|uniref:CoA-disulfide reductase n=1 Tax=Enterococcus diestrammenae TaxID=1155073 RepID=UPI0022E17B2C|nr:CoA-disulfide reductase [Enterococcus diestrammenae]